MPINRSWRRSMLEAVIHPACIDPPDGSCDVCGLLFFPTWAFFMPGNFWTARCSYVNKLIHPLEFELKKKNLNAYLDELKKGQWLIGSIFPDRRDTRGLERFAAGESNSMQATS